MFWVTLGKYNPVSASAPPVWLRFCLGNEQKHSTKPPFGCQPSGLTCSHRVSPRSEKKRFFVITLYGVYRSRASRPLWLLAELNMKFSHIPVMQAYRLPQPTAADAPFNTGSPAFLAVSSLGQIPVYTEGDLVLTESLAICLHIARQYGGALGPQTPAEAALMDQWTLFAATAVEGPALEILYVVDAGGDKTPEGQASMAVNAEKLRRPLARLQAHLQATDWMVGARFSVADIIMAECLRYAQSHPTLIAEFPAIAGWLARCQGRAAFKAMWAARVAE